MKLTSNQYSYQMRNITFSQTKRFNFGKFSIFGLRGNQQS